MDDGADAVETDGAGGTVLSSSSAPHSEDSQGFVPLSSVDLDGEESGSGKRSGDPWARISELPPRLGDKMMDLKKERLVVVVE